MSDDGKAAQPADDLGFEVAVREIIAPVLAEFGLTVVDSGDREVRFESNLVWSQVTLGTRFPISFDFALREGHEEGWYLTSDAMRLVDPAAAAQDLDFIAQTPDRVRLGLERLKGTLEAYCAQALRGDADVFEAMLQARDLFTDQLNDWHQRSRQMGLNGALDRRDWARVVEIYQSAQHDLLLNDSRRLEVARQNLRTGQAAGPAVRADPEFMTQTIRAYRSNRVFFSRNEAEDEYWSLELAVGEAMGAGDWARVIELYECSSVELEDLQQMRLEIARRKLATTRELSPAEADLLGFLVTGMCDDAAPVLSQLDGARVAIDDDAATWLQIEVRPDADPVDLPDEPIPGRATVVDPDGSVRGELFVWVDDGRLAALQQDAHTGEPPTAMPALDTVRVLPAPRMQRPRTEPHTRTESRSRTEPHTRTESRSLGRSDHAEVTVNTINAVALATEQEAVAHERELAAASPNGERPELAYWLRKLSVRLSGLGRREEALSAAQEAVSVYRELRWPRADADKQALALSLITLSQCLGAVGRREDAVTAAQEAVVLHRELAAASTNGFTGYLAGALVNLARRLSEAGRQEEARAATQEVSDFA